MRILKNHDHGAALIAHIKRNGNYNLWEYDHMYGKGPRMIIEDATIEDLKLWREEEYRGLDVLPGIDAGKIGRELIPYKWRKMAPEKMSLEEYLGQRGLSSPVCDYDLDKVRLPHGETARQREQRIQESVNAQNKYAARRREAIREYQEKVDKGQIVPKTVMERRLDAARGHPDNSATQADRRILEKQGIDWQTGELLSKQEELSAKYFDVELEAEEMEL